MHKQTLRKPSLVAIFACWLLLGANPIPVSAKARSTDKELTQQAIHLYEQKQPQQAIDLERQAVKRKRGKWLPHAVLSYFLWQQSRWQDAITEGKLAARLAPRKPVLLINLGIMQQRFNDPASAAVYFGKARALAPTDWRAWIGQAQSLSFSPGRSDEALDILNEMASQNSNDFNWYYELGKAYLLIDRPGLAADADSKAIALASTEQQKSNSLFQLFSAYIRDNQIERANELKHQVFCDYKPTDAQIYVRAASSLVPVLHPGAADEILNAAAANLAKPDDAETLFRLARIFEDKANYVSYDRTKYGAWLGNEEAAYRQAIKLNSSLAIIHVGLASILAQKGQADEMTQELTKAWAIDEHDQLTGYLLSKMKPSQTARTERQPNLSDNPATAASHLHLTEAKIAVTGLSCSCKLNNVADSFRQINGVVLTTMSPQIPYKATVLIDQSMIPIADALVQMDKKKPFPQLTYELLSSRPIESAGDALRIEVEGIALNNWFFATNFTQLQATLPVSAAAEAPSITNYPVSNF